MFYILFNINNFSPATLLFFFNLKTTEYSNKLVEICHFINDDKKNYKIHINYKKKYTHKQKLIQGDPLSCK